MNIAKSRTGRGKKYTYEERSLTLEEWAEQKNIPYSTLSYRLRQGWAIEKALTTGTHEETGRTSDSESNKVRINVGIEHPVVVAIDWVVGPPTKGKRDQPNRSFTINYLVRTELELPPLELSEVGQSKTTALEKRLKLWRKKPPLDKFANLTDLGLMTPSLERRLKARLEELPPSPNPGQVSRINVFFDSDVLEKIDSDEPPIHRQNGLRSRTVNRLLRQALRIP